METGEALVVFRGVPNCQGWEIWSKLFNQSTGSIPGHDLARGREKHTKTHTWIGKTRNSCSLLVCTEVRSCGAKLRGCCNTNLFNDDRVNLIEYDCGNRDDKSSSSTRSERNAYFHGKQRMRACTSPRVSHVHCFKKNFDSVTDH